MSAEPLADGRLRRRTATVGAAVGVAELGLQPEIVGGGRSLDQTFQSFAKRGHVIAVLRPHTVCAEVEDRGGFAQHLTVIVGETDQIRL